MPTYDYVCDACDHQFELFQSITAAAERKCPECGRRKLRRLIGPGAAIVFKGSGFYKTDYRSESYKKAAASETGGGANGAAGSSGSAGADGHAQGKSGAKGKSAESAGAKDPG